MSLVPVFFSYFWESFQFSLLFLRKSSNFFHFLESWCTKNEDFYASQLENFKDSLNLSKPCYPFWLGLIFAEKCTKGYGHSLFFGHAEGLKLAARIDQELKNDCLPAANLSTLLKDGPNLNKTIFNKLQSLIKAENAQFNGFVDLGSCILHNVHNSFGKGLKQFGKKIDRLCLDLYSLFKYSAARREDY